jgi:hypothetical protein
MLIGLSLYDLLYFRCKEKEKVGASEASRYTVRTHAPLGPAGSVSTPSKARLVAGFLAISSNHLRQT